MTINNHQAMPDEEIGRVKGHLLSCPGLNQDDSLKDILTSNPDSRVFLLDLDSSLDECQQMESNNGSEDDDDDRCQPQIRPMESFWAILAQVVVPFFLAGCGTVGAGLILDSVHVSTVFNEIPEIVILVPALLGLKGNIEMTLASRLSTEANMGKFKGFRSMIRLVLGNLYFVQFQAIAVGFVASVSPYWLGSPPKTYHHAFLLSASSVVTTSVASLFLGILMSSVVILSRKYDINPDNVAAPLAASIGDIVTLTLLYVSATMIYSTIDDMPWIAPSIVGFYILCLIFWATVSYRHKFTKRILLAPSTWLPIFGGMLVSCFAGKIFDFGVRNFKNIAVLQPTMNGVGGNIAAVQASRISTYLHCHLKVTQLEPERICAHPVTTFWKGTHAKSALALLLLLIPGHLIFILLIWLVHCDLDVGFVFLCVYVLAAVIQVVSLLYLVDVLVHLFWRHKIDPDNAAIPCLTSLGDFLGAILLVGTFFLVNLSSLDMPPGN